MKFMTYVAANSPRMTDFELNIVDEIIAWTKLNLGKDMDEYEHEEIIQKFWESNTQ